MTLVYFPAARGGGPHSALRPLAHAPPTQHLVHLEMKIAHLQTLIYLLQVVLV